MTQMDGKGKKENVRFGNLSKSQQDFFLTYAPRDCLGEKAKIFKEKFRKQFPELVVTDKDFSCLLKYRREMRMKERRKKAATDRRSQLRAGARDYWRNRRRAIIAG
ncbi:MAG: hypothetical protein A2599_03540 [Candidatus Staskawiczbacteria bacterium RIFOXYD1_FULL_39_28]|uniref:Uncharacterized protein n=1 Tax=Candidatus Staskawiczbacteria bacterium RIFOXYC1_FULL_38_18 TaxID=1802229 RepID=A0A1G2JDT9_9BACT|nr:MAG: hypothetical protein A2401_01425 [Candidatus Staskawiczbacteria bacterium RIFOXYC1_FULL_38_18]OGZ91513.1 MAG: hypothetical protein A2599_03540 [Candidatus Staskawiczbacteria bacterium RIFOXYD1_FULL_39_28]